MQIVTPDFVADLCGLSPGLLICGAAVGLVLWLFGWKWHRFWVVLVTTVVAGVYALQEGNDWKTPPLVAAIMMAIAAGILALALVRLLAFWAGGVSGLLIVQATAPTFDQPLVVFIIAGLLSLLLFRWFLMALTSLAGSVLLCYAGLGLLNFQGALNAVVWIEQGASLLNWVCGLMAVMGFVFQFLIDRRASRSYVEEDCEDDGILYRFSRFYRRAG